MVPRNKRMKSSQIVGKSKIEIEKFYSEIRNRLRGTEIYEFLKDVKSLGWKSPKAKAYAKSEAYKFLRCCRLEMDDNRCGKCGAEKKLQLHHKTYKNFFCENLEDCIMLCGLCHLKTHGKQKSYRKKNRMKEQTISETSIKNSKYLRNLSKNREFARKYLILYANLIKNPQTNYKKDSANEADRQISVIMGYKKIIDIKRLREKCGISFNGPIIRMLTFISQARKVKNCISIEEWVDKYLQKILEVEENLDSNNSPKIEVAEPRKIDMQRKCIPIYYRLVESGQIDITELPSEIAKEIALNCIK